MSKTATEIRPQSAQWRGMPSSPGLFFRSQIGTLETRTFRGAGFGFFSSHGRRCDHSEPLWLWS